MLRLTYTASHSCKKYCLRFISKSDTLPLSPASLPPVIWECSLTSVNETATLLTEWS